MKTKTMRAAMLLLVMLLTTMTAWATTTSSINVGGTDYTLFTGFTATGGTNASATAYNYPNLVDGNLDGSSSWHPQSSDTFVEFNTDDPIVPKGYIFNTYMEGYFYPHAWVLKAKANATDGWTTLSSKSGQSLSSGQEFQYACDNSGNNAYKYFRFEVSNSSNNIWLTEIRLYGNEYIYYTHLTVTPATCTATGIKQECYKRSDGKFFTDETGATELAESDVIEPMIAHTGVHHEAGDGNIEYWQCSMCSKYFTDAACTQEVTADEVLKTVFGTLTAGTNGASGYYTLESKTYTLTADVNTNGYIYVPEGVTATIDLNGHTIDRGLTSAVTNGMVIRVAGSLTVTDSGTGGKIKGGMDSSADHVSCVKVYSDNGSPTFTLAGGTLIGNTSNEGNRAVYVAFSAHFIMTGGKITGDVCGINASGHLTISGGEISGNTYGIWSMNYSVSMSGNPVITNNTSANVQLYYYGASVLTIAGELTDGANIGITIGGARPTDNAPVTITSGYSTYNNEPIGTYFSLDNNGQIQTGPSEYMTVVMGWNEDKTEIAVGTAMRTVTFDLQGHGSAIEDVSLLSGYKLTCPTEPTAEGWSFGGWFTNTDFAEANEWNFDSGITSDMTLYALWTQGQIYRVTLPEKMVIVSTTNALVGGKYPTGTNIRFKVAPDYVVDGDVKNGEDVLTADGDGIYTVTVADADITITATVKKAAEPNKTLSGSESYTAQDGDVLTGSTSGTVTIASDASITLSDVTITGGIICNGSATITLVGTNIVNVNNAALAYSKAGIQIGSSGTTLTIRGSGSLTATGGTYSAGIGLGRTWDASVTAGAIVIEGGTVTASGGNGIGTGTVGNDKTASIDGISIKGGTVCASLGKGTINYGSTVTIGYIKIYDTIDMVDASKITETVTYMHVDGESATDVTANKTDFFTIGEDGNRRLIVQKPVIAEIAEQAYTGSEIKPEPTVTIGSITLTKGTDYVYSYTNNTDVGTAKVRATFQGTYSSLGYVEKEFTILPSTVMVSVTGSGTVTCGDRSATDGTSFGVMSEKGASVALTLAPESGYAVRSVAYGYTNNSGTTASGLKLPISGTTATLTVPDNLKDGTGVTVTVTFAPALNGGADEASAVALTDATVTDLGGGWYKVENDISFDHTLNLLADTYLTIAEGKTMTVNTASDTAIDSEYTLNVSGEGALNITTTETEIAVRVGSYVQTGATVTASGYIGIRCLDDFEEFNVTNDFTFSGGQLTATGSGYGNGIDADNDITLSCSNATDFIQASSYRSTFGAVKIAEGKALTDGTEASNGMNGYSGTLTNEQITAIGGKTLHRAVTTSYVEANGTLHENVVAIPLDNTMTTLAAGWYVVNSNVTFTQTVTTTGDVTLILGDGCTMSFGTEVDLLDGTIIECNSHNLTIYGQSGGTGWLKAYSAQYNGIHVNNYTQYSGNVVICVVNGACIYANNSVTLLGGTLDVESEGEVDGEITGGSISILGGKLWARNMGLWSPQGITLGYTNATDQIYVKIYHADGMGLKIADGKTLVNDNGEIWSGALLNIQIEHGINDRTLKPLVYSGVTLTKDGSGNVSATFNGTSETTLSIPENVTVTSVTYNRTFTEGRPATVMLPFSLSSGQTLTGGTLYKFTGVTKNETAGKWEATMTETATLQANTPYLLMPDENLVDGKVTFNLGSSWSTVTLNTTGGGNEVTSGSWKLVGSYTSKTWAAEDPEIRKAYFINNEGALEKIEPGMTTLPTSCYLLKESENFTIYDSGSDAENNTTAIETAAASGKTYDVTLAGRTLYKDGKWNTLCLPFALSAEQIAAHADFSVATLMELDTDGKNGFDPTDGTLYLTFKAATAIAAGVPYLVKWEKAADYEGNEANYDISNPVFEGVTVSSTAAQAVESTTAGLESVQMVGCYSPVSVTADDKSILFLGDANTLYYSTTDRQIRSCRAYFSVPYIKGNAGAKARAFALNFDGEDVTGILGVTADSTDVKDGVWYSLDGVRLSGKPTQRGLYINNGKKVVIK